MQDTKEQIILLLSNMLSSCEEVVKKSSEELKLLCDDPEYVVGLSRVINSKYSCILRQGAGSILSMQLMVASDWESVPSKNQAEIQTELLGALKSLMNDDSEELLLVVVRNVSLLLGLEQGATTGRQWSEEVFNYIESVCLSSNIKEQNMGAAIYNSLADVAPKVLPKYMKRGQKIFMSGILLAEERGCLVTPYTELLISGLTRALPLGHKYLSMTINPVLPSVMRVVTAFAYLPNLEKCDRGFDLMSNLLQYKPKLIWRQLPCVLEHLFLLASDNNLADAMRNKAIVYIRRLIEAKRRKITKMNMLDPLILVLLRVIAADSAYDAPEDEEMQSDDLPPTPVYTAAEALSFLVSESHSNKIAPRVFRLLRPQMEEESTQAQRVGVYLTLIVLSESFTEVLLKDNMLEFISICHAGISDDDSMVRRSACFSMSSMVTHFMPEITIMVDTVMPMFFEFLEHMTETQRFAAKESAVNECVFNTLEVYVENVTAECMKPHLQKLIPLLLLCTEPEQNSVSLRQLSLSVIAKTAEHMKTYLDNYFEDIVSVIRPLMVQTELKQELVLSAHAIHVCSALSLVSQSKFSSMALWILEVVMEMLSDSTDTQFSTDQISRLGGQW
ncbi:importin-4-like [Drosophila tropicalis]|uniref:importin-4-like n=1 Tax=Drosophila tropicalis TaxID=46794 RepID=UPI0035AB98C3